MIKIVGYLLLILSLPAYALVPVEGILMGQARDDIQSDPLRSIFSNMYDMSQRAENNKVKLYQTSYQSGENLQESCGYLTKPTYSTPWAEKQARRTIVSNLQYVGLDTSIKAVGAYANKLGINAEDFKRLQKNLMNNYCSKNITIFSQKTISRALQYYYENPEMEIIPSISSSPFATPEIINSSEKPAARSREFDLVIDNFKAFCSWGGDVDDYRMLTRYLSNPFIMVFVFKNMAGIQAQVDDNQQKVIHVKSNDTVQVGCTDLICRKVTPEVFKKNFPLSVGSTGLTTDLYKNYCHHFRFNDSPGKSIANVKKWKKEQELEDPIFETSQFISLMTGVPDLFTGADTYTEVPLLIKSSIDEKWNKWSQYVLSAFSKDLQFEESLKVKIEPKTKVEVALNGFEVDFSITLGELDRILTKKDNFNLTFDLKLSKNYLRAIRTKWAHLAREVDTEGIKDLKTDIGRYLNIQLKEKEKLFAQKMWNEDFPDLIAHELLQQTLNYKGSLFDSYEDEVLKVPVKFSYGLFALSYLRYRADVASGHSKSNL